MLLSTPPSIPNKNVPTETATASNIAVLPAPFLSTTNVTWLSKSIIRHPNIHIPLFYERFLFLFVNDNM